MAFPAPSSLRPSESRRGSLPCVLGAAQVRWQQPPGRITIAKQTRVFSHACLLVLSVRALTLGAGFPCIVLALPCSITPASNLHQLLNWPELSGAKVILNHHLHGKVWTSLNPKVIEITPSKCSTGIKDAWLAPELRLESCAMNQMPFQGDSTRPWDGWDLVGASQVGRWELKQLEHIQFSLKIQLFGHPVQLVSCQASSFFFLSSWKACNSFCLFVCFLLYKYKFNAKMPKVAEHWRVWEANGGTLEKTELRPLCGLQCPLPSIPVVPWVGQPQQHRCAGMPFSPAAGSWSPGSFLGAHGAGLDVPLGCSCSTAIVKHLMSLKLVGIYTERVREC